MRVLWLTNVPVPDASASLGRPVTHSGGWLVASSQALVAAGVEVSMAFPGIGARAMPRHVSRGGGDYFEFREPSTAEARSPAAYPAFVEILATVRPDLVHIHGSEFAHTLAMVTAGEIERVPVVVSIQGLVSVAARHYMAHLPIDVQRRMSLRDILRRDGLRQQQRKFAHRGELEVEALARVRYVIGRTSWDAACVERLSPTARYFHGNESLRASFYESAWDVRNCRRHTVFVSQGTYPLKGLHLVLEALAQVVEDVPDARLVVAGPSMTGGGSPADRLRRPYYWCYIRELISRYRLDDHVTFAGVLDEVQMRRAYLQANVYVLASSVENSPNSLGEAMLLGVPCVAAHVGGVPDLLIPGVDGFTYPADAPYMLAHHIRTIFSDDALAGDLSRHARAHASRTHDVAVNTSTLLAIYETVLAGGSGGPR